MAEASRKRPRQLDEEAGDLLPSRAGHSFKEIHIGGSAQVFLGDQHHSTTPRGADHELKVFDFERLRDSLCFGGIEFRVNNVRQALGSTCEWLFRHEAFRKWSNPAHHESNILWIRGHPGCGKSTLMKMAFERIRQNQFADNAIIIPYFFNARSSNDLDKSPLGFYRTVAFKLLSSCPSLKEVFFTLFAHKKSTTGDIVWHETELQNFLYESFKATTIPQIYLFVDALDEAKIQDEVRQLVAFLLDLSVESAGAHKIRLCLSSRHYPEITVRTALALDVEKESGHRQAIESYVDRRLTCLDGDQRSSIRSAINQKSANIFLWTVIVVEIINKLDDEGASIMELQQRLTHIPSGLNELFREVLAKETGGIQRSVLLFQWMLFSQRPMSPAELLSAIELGGDSQTSAREIQKMVLRLTSEQCARRIKHLSRGLVEIVARDPARLSMVQFIHESVREFLLGKDGLMSLSSDLSQNLSGISHETLRAACSRCILSTEPPNVLPDNPEEVIPVTKRDYDNLLAKGDRALRELPLMRYAIRHVFDHADVAERRSILQDAFLSDQVTSDGCWNGHNRRWWNLTRSGIVKKDTSFVIVLLLVRAAALLDRLFKLPNADIFAKMKDADVAMELAAESGEIRLLEVLISAGFNINAKSSDVPSPLARAVDRDDIDAVKLLLDAGADPNTQGIYHSTVLHAAILEPSLDIVQILLDSRPCLDPCDDEWGTPLQITVLARDRKAMMKLLAAGADVNAHSGIYGTALQAAATLFGGNDDVELVQILLDHGAKVNLSGGYHGCALQAALDCGNPQIAALLRRHGATTGAET